MLDSCSCGTAGGDPHLQRVAMILDESAREDGTKVKTALIHSEQDKDYLKRKLRAG